VAPVREEPAPGRICIRITPGERAAEAQRAEWREALKDRPDMLRRLLEGEPGTLQLGAQVAVGFNRDCHVSKEPLRPQHGSPLVIGWDAGHQPSAILGQRLADGTIAVYAALTTHGGTYQLIEDVITPWVAAHAPWVLKSPPWERRMAHYVDPSMRTGSQHDTRHSPVTEIKARLGGPITDGAVSWPGRRDPVDFPLFSTVDVKVSVRRTCSGAGPASGIARLWYNGQPIDGGAMRDAGTRLDVVSGAVTTGNFLRSESSLSTARRDPPGGPSM
jgi:hypothetical protein